MPHLSRRLSHSLYCSDRRFNVDPSTYGEVKRAYEFALAHIGQDKDSGDIWKEYIDFVVTTKVRRVLRLRL